MLRQAVLVAIESGVDISAQVSGKLAGTNAVTLPPSSCSRSSPVYC